MDLIADIFLLAAALGATFYCIVLSRRLNRFTDLEKGVGGAIAALSAQVQDMTRTLKSAQGAASESASSLGALTGRAEDAARRLELLVAAMHDLPPVPAAKPAPAQTTTPVRTAEPAPTAPADAAAEPAEDTCDQMPAFSSRRAGSGGA